MFLILAAGLMLVGTSCDKDTEGCTDPDAENYNKDANVDDGSCTYARDKFLGSYQVSEACTTGNYSYSVTIVESVTAPNMILIQNFGNFATTVNVPATVSGENITFNYTQDGVTFSGSGSITGNTLVIIYQASGGFTDSCTMTCIKQ